MTPESPTDMKMEPTRSSWLDQLTESDAIDAPVTSIVQTKNPADLDRLPNKQDSRSVQESNASPEPLKNTSPRWMKIFLVWISLIAVFESFLLFYGWFSLRSSPAITRLADAASVGSAALDTSANSLRGKDINANRPELIVSAAGDTAYTTIASAIEAAKEGALILVKPGTYRENVLLDKSLTIQGIGKREDIRVESSTGTVMAIEAPQVVVRGLTIARLIGAGERALQAVEIRSGQTTLDDCDVASATGNGIDVIGVDASFKLTRCRLHDTVKSGVWLKVGASCEVDDCNFEKIGVSCIIANQSSQLLVQKSRFSDSDVGVFAHHAQAHIIECNFSGFSNSAIQVTNRAKATIDACEISKCKDSALVAADESTLNVTRCKILDSTLVAIVANSQSHLQVADTEIIRSKIAIASTDADIICCRMRVEDCSSDGFKVLKKSRVMLLESEFRNCTNAINLKEEGVLTALQCGIFDSIDHGVAVSENASLTMQLSEVFSAKKACIFCMDNSAINLSSCKIHGSLTQAILGTDDSRAQLLDCDVFENGDQHILLRKRHHMSIQGGKVYSTKNVGIMALESVSLSARDCQINGCEQLGVRVLSDTLAQLVNVEFAKNGVSVYVDKTGKLELESCKSVEPLKYDWHVVEGGELIGKNNSPELGEKRASKGGK